MSPDPGRGEVLWVPSEERRARSRLSHFEAWLASHHGLAFDGYGDLWRWSVEDPAGFWGRLWEYFELSDWSGPDVLRGTLPDVTWFAGARLNYAERAVLASAPAAEALLGLSSDGATRLSGAELADLVARVRAGLVVLGVAKGDRVAGYLPNGVEAVAGFLATASLGAIWSSCPHEFGATAVVDRFGQIRPKVLIAIDGYRYGDKFIDRRADLGRIIAGLPGLSRVVVVSQSDPEPPAGSVPVTAWADLVARFEPMSFEGVAFDHPLYILYSSGTTGPPKPIVHGHGGILLEHLKTLALHCDLGPADRFFWFSTTGWMMWNFLVSGLLVGATVVCFDGDPMYPGPDSLWEMAGAERLTFFGTSAPFIHACARAGLEPGRRFDLSRLRTVGSTGAPLSPDGYRWVYRAVAGDVMLSSISGGTDVCTAFLGGIPTLPVRAGEMAGAYLGAGADVFSPDGHSLTGTEGELVVTAPMPSMPVGLWGDDDGSRRRATYFARYPGVWHHGDWATRYPDGSWLISGRSDATLNRAGVRLGTAEIYSVVESHPAVADSLVVHLEDATGGPGTLVLFVVARGPGWGPAQEAELRAQLRSSLSPRHVPDRIVAVPAVPRTLSGKKLEVPVKRILMGRPIEEVAAAGALADPGALQPFAELAGRLGPGGPAAIGGEDTAPVAPGPGS